MRSLAMEYRVLLLVHILAGMAWVGGAIVIETTLFVTRRSKPPEEVDRVMRSFAWADTWIALLAPLLVVVTGVTMVLLSGSWSFGQAWILGSIGLVVGYEAIAMTIGARLYRRLDTARRDGTLESAAHVRTMRSWGRLGAILLTLLVAVVGLMVFKPGA
jgi:uncharacterized membrane protein